MDENSFLLNEIQNQLVDHATTSSPKTFFPFIEDIGIC